jgi:DNA-directed RNA polymerase subunit RPC12/RpoP
MQKLNYHPANCLGCGAPTTDTDEDGWMECHYCGIEYVIRKNKLVTVPIASANNGGVAVLGSVHGDIKIGGDVVGGDKIVYK